MRRPFLVIEEIADNLGLALDFVHVGANPPILRAGSAGPRTVRPVADPVVETLLAEGRDADLAAMPMAGATGLADTLRDRTTERLVREARCPLLALPVAR